jgi:hypothetical protein
MKYKINKWKVYHRGSYPCGVCNKKKKVGCFTYVIWNMRPIQFLAYACSDKCVNMSILRDI